MISLVILLAIVVAVSVVAYVLAPPSWRTMAVNAALGVLALLAELAAALEGLHWQSFVPEGAAAWIILAITLINIVFRWKTTTPAMLPRDQRPVVRRGGR